MTERSVLISGAGVAGPALAYFLHRAGYVTTVVERAPESRTSGYTVDFRGAALGVLEQLGLLDAVRAHDTRMRGVTLVDDEGAELEFLPTERFSGDLEVPKPVLTQLLRERTRDDVEYVFDDTITALDQDEHGVDVEFQRGAPRRFDLVVGADGVHSRVRRLAFVPHDHAVRHLGYSGVGFTTANHLGLDHRGLLQHGSGVAVYVFSAENRDELTVSLSFGTDTPDLDRQGRAAQERAVRAAFAGRGGPAPALLRAMAQAEDFYFSSACQVHLDSWSTGRVVLVGDAGYCAAPSSGTGTSQALVGAGTLARLLTATGDHPRAFVAYEQELRPSVAENQAKGRASAATFGAAEAQPDGTVTTRVPTSHSAGPV